jgi:hypothetical protein
VFYANVIIDRASEDTEGEILIERSRNHGTFMVEG